MGCVTVIWSMVASACLTLAVVRLCARCRRRSHRDNNLLESEARYASMFHGAIEGMFRSTVEGRCLFANYALARMLGYGSEEEVTSVIQDSAHQVWADPEERARYVRSLAEQGAVRAYECRFKRKDGTRIWVSISARTFRRPDGRVAHIDGFVEDVTERRRREDDLRLSGARVTSAADVAGLGFSEMDANTSMTFPDQRIRELFGLPPGAEARGREWWLAHIHPDDLPRVLQMSKDILEGGHDEVGGEYRYMHPSRGRLWFHQRSRVLERDASGRLVRLLAVVQEITERKEAEAELRKSQVRLTSGAELAGLGFYEAVDGWDVTYVDDRARGLFGLPPDRLQGTAVNEFWLEHIHPADRQGILDASQQLAGGTPDRISREYRYLHPDGRELWIHHLATVTERGAGGRCRRVIGVVRDITEQKRAETAVIESELRYRALFESAPEGIVLIGMDGRVYAANRVQARLYGYDSPEQLNGLYTPLLVAEKDRMRATLNMSAQLEGHDVPSRRYTLVRRDGTEFIGEVTSAPLRSPQHEMQGYLCLTRDVTALVESEAALRTSEERFRSLFAAMGEGVLVQDADGRVTACNACAERILGLSADQMTGATSTHAHWRAVHEDGSAFPGDLHPAMVTVRTGQACSHVVMGIYRPDGALVWVSMNAQPLVRDGESKPHAAVVTFADITDRRQMELDAVQSRQELAHISRGAAMGQLVASLAHELNQPLTAILSNAQAAQRLLGSGRPDLGEIREILADIAADDRRAGEVVRRVRALLRKGDVDHMVIDVNAVTREVLGLLRTNAIIHAVSVVTKLSPGPLPVLGDRIQLQQVLLNLVLNAYDAMQTVPAGRRELIVESQRLESGRAFVSVRDSGPGISPAIMGRLFQPFSTSKPEGLGMGLSICRSILESHGGRICAESNPGQGATFRFELPLAKGGAA